MTTHASKLRALTFSMFTVMLHAQVNIESRPILNTTVWRYPSIFVAEFDDVQAHGWPAPSTTVHARATKILKDALHLGLQPGEFDVTLLQCFGACSAANAHHWTNQDVRSGQKYVIFSRSKVGLQAMVADPVSAAPVTDKDDAVAVVEWILSSASLSIFDQARGAATMLNPPSEHGFLLAQYVAALLASGSDTDTGPLLSALEGSGALAFSDSAKLALLFYLSQNSHSWGMGHDNLLRAYVNLVARYFVLEAREWRPGITHLQVEIVLNHLPGIFASDRASTILRQLAQNNELRQQLKSRASKCAVDSRLTPKEQAAARQLSAVLEITDR